MPSWTSEQFKDYEDRVRCKLSHRLLKRNETPALDHPADREEKSVARIVVRFTGKRVRPLDPDNFAGSVKDLLDGLRHSGLIPGDEPWRIRLETEQIRVAHFKDEKTVIEIYDPRHC